MSALPHAVTVPVGPAQMAAAGLRAFVRIAAGLGPDASTSRSCLLGAAAALDLLRLAQAPRQGQPAARHAGAPVQPAGHLQEPADPAARRRPPPTPGCASPTAAPLFGGAQRAAAHAGRQRQRPEPGAPLPRRRARRRLVLTPRPTPAASACAGAQACRIVPTRHPTIYLYDRVADAADFDALYALEAMTNDRLRDELGQIERVPRGRPRLRPRQRPDHGRLHPCQPDGQPLLRRRLRCLLRRAPSATPRSAETAYHHARFLAATARGADAPADAAVPRGHRRPTARPARRLRRRVHAPDDYGAVARARRPAARRRLGRRGLPQRAPCRRAVRRAVPAARRRRPACTRRILLYAWDGARFTDVYEKLA